MPAEIWMLAKGSGERHHEKSGFMWAVSRQQVTKKTPEKSKTEKFPFIELIIWGLTRRVLIRETFKRSIVALEELQRSIASDAESVDRENAVIHSTNLAFKESCQEESNCWKTASLWFATNGHCKYWRMCSNQMKLEVKNIFMVTSGNNSIILRSEGMGWWMDVNTRQP